MTACKVCGRPVEHGDPSDPYCTSVCCRYDNGCSLDNDPDPWAERAVRVEPPKQTIVKRL